MVAGAVDDSGRTWRDYDSNAGVICRAGGARVKTPARPPCRACLADARCTIND